MSDNYEETRIHFGFLHLINNEKSKPEGPRFYGVVLALFISVSDNIVMLIGHISDVLTLVGDIIIAYAVIAVHDRMREEHSIDDAVYTSMLKERRMIVLGISLIFAGFTLRIIERVVA